MKLLFSAAVAAAFLIGCGPKMPKVTATDWVTWDKKMIDFGPLKKGEKRTSFFELTNTTAETVQVDIIDHCDCTTADYPRGPIPVGEKRRIDFTFDSATKDSSETISIRLIWKQRDKHGNPRFDELNYKFELVK